MHQCLSSRYGSAVRLIDVLLHRFSRAVNGSTLCERIIVTGPLLVFLKLELKTRNRGIWHNVGPKLEPKADDYQIIVISASPS